MSVADGQNVNAAVSNAAWMSRTVDTSTIGVVTLNNTATAESGALITNAQRAINETFDAVGMTGEGDATRKNYSSNNILTNGEDHKVSLGKVDAEFHATTGHAHGGATGDGTKIVSANVVYTPTAPLTTTNVQAALDEAAVLIAGSPAWTKFTVTHTALQAAALTNDIELFSLAALGTIHGIVIKHTVAFAGTGITAYRISIGVAADLEKHSLPFNVLQAIGDTVKDVTSVLDLESFSGATSIRIAAEAVGANLDQSSAGSVDVYVLSSTLPS